MEKNVSLLMECIRHLNDDTVRYQGYQRALLKYNQNVANSAQVKQENAARAAQGLPPLSDAELATYFKVWSERKECEVGGHQFFLFLFCFFVQLNTGADSAFEARGAVDDGTDQHILPADGKGRHAQLWQALLDPGNPAQTSTHCVGDGLLEFVRGRWFVIFNDPRACTTSFSLLGVCVCVYSESTI